MYEFFHEVSTNGTLMFFLIPQGNRRETRLLGILSFVHSTVWKVLFGKVNAVVFLFVYIFPLVQWLNVKDICKCILFVSN